MELVVYPFAPVFLSVRWIASNFESDELCLCILDKITRNAMMDSFSKTQLMFFFYHDTQQAILRCCASAKFCSLSECPAFGLILKVLHYFVQFV